MRKKIIITAVLLVIIVIFGIFILKNKSVTNSTTRDEIVLEKAETKTYNYSHYVDPAGFEFDYIDGIFEINKHPENTIYYAYIDFNMLQNSDGLVTIISEDPPVDPVTKKTLTNLKDYVSQKKFEGASIVDTTLGGLEAKKILNTDGSETIINNYENLFVSVTIRSKQKEFTDLYNKITETFKLTPFEDIGSSSSQEVENVDNNYGSLDVSEETLE